MSRAFAAGIVFAVVLIWLLTRRDSPPDGNRKREPYLRRVS